MSIPSLILLKEEEKINSFFLPFFFSFFGFSVFFFCNKKDDSLKVPH